MKKLSFRVSECLFAVQTFRMWFSLGRHRISRFGFRTSAVVGVWLLTQSAGLGQTPVEAWVQRYGIICWDCTDNPHHLAVDSSDDVVVTGRSMGYDRTSDFATIKYSAAGTALWTNRHDGDDIDMTVDVSGNVFVTGSAGFRDESSNFYSAAITIKYSGTGVPLWTNKNSELVPAAMGVDSGGNLFVTGSTWSPASRANYTTIKYSGAGVPLWTNSYSGPWSDYPVALAVDGSGNVIVTGVCEAENGTDDYATVKYSAAGVPLWTNRYNGPGNLYDGPCAVAVDANGNVFVTGESYGGSASYYDYATIKYSAAGVALWTRRFDGAEHSRDYASALAVDGAGNVVVTGYSYGIPQTATIKYSSAGAVLWTRRDCDGVVPEVAIDRSSNVVMIGQELEQCVIISYSSAGLPLWTNRFRVDTYYPAALGVDSGGNVVATASSSPNGYDNDFLTIKYAVAALSPLPLNHRVLDNRLVLSWTNTAFGLQSAPTPIGPYTNILGARSPHTNTLWEAGQFFRLKGN